ncbi:MAG: molecular chaperone GrpE [Thermoleophilaceae bacterium]|nr:molecular chaperone GrpE [Thermoleophilaceae bacterium]
MTRQRPTEDSVREQLHRDSTDPSRQAGDVTSQDEGDGDDAVARVEAARSAEARMATETANPVESADAATRGDEPDQAPATGANGDGVTPGSAAADAQAEAEVAAEGETPDELAELRAERDRYLDLARRTQADFDNYRKRAAKDSAAAGARAKAGLVRELLPVVDNLERALASANESDTAIAAGVRLVHADLVGMLERNGIESSEPAGERFDPTLHEAVSMRSEDGAEPGIVLDVVEKGYRLGDTVIRPARVVVSG